MLSCRLFWHIGSRVCKSLSAGGRCSCLPSPPLFPALHSTQASLSHSFWGTPPCINQSLFLRGPPKASVTRSLSLSFCGVPPPLDTASPYAAAASAGAGAGRVAGGSAGGCLSVAGGVAAAVTRGAAPGRCTCAPPHSTRPAQGRVCVWGGAQVCVCGGEGGGW